jgi:hypothetical protein
LKKDGLSSNQPEESRILEKKMAGQKHVLVSHFHKDRELGPC